MPNDFSKNLFARGAEAKLYISSIFDKQVLVKERTKKEYRAKELDERIRKLRTKNEAKIILKASAAGINVPRIFSVGEFDIYMKKISGKRLRETNLNSEKGREALEKSGKILAKMHGIGITHGDFTPANLMLCSNEVYVIDFGLASLSNELEEKAVDVLLMEKSISTSQFIIFLEGYQNYKEWKNVLKRVEEIKKRGRYQIRAEETEENLEENGE